MLPFAHPLPQKKDVDAGGGGETRYARPCRPVKPLDIMCVVGRRWVRHLWQCRCEVGVGVVVVRKGGWGGEEEGELVVEAVDVEERRRKGREGRR